MFSTFFFTSERSFRVLNLVFFFFSSEILKDCRIEKFSDDLIDLANQSVIQSHVVPVCLITWLHFLQQTLSYSFITFLRALFKGFFTGWQLQSRWIVFLWGIYFYLDRYLPPPPIFFLLPRTTTTTTTTRSSTSLKWCSGRMLLDCYCYSNSEQPSWTQLRINRPANRIRRSWNVRENRGPLFGANGESTARPKVPPYNPCLLEDLMIWILFPISTLINVNSNSLWCSSRPPQSELPSFLLSDLSAASFGLSIL